MSSINTQAIRKMQAIDNAYGDRSDSKVVPNDKSTKYKPNFSRMSVQDIMSSENEDFEYDDAYETA